MDRCIRICRPHRAHDCAFFVVFALCFVGAIVQLGGLASVQSTCATDLSSLLELNDASALLKELSLGRTQLEAILALDPNGPLYTAAMNQFILLSYPAAVEGLATIASRSATSAFSLTPETTCSSYYRYFWVGFAFETLTLAYIAHAVWCKAAGSKHLIATVATCCFLTLSTGLAIQNCHASWHLAHLAPELVPTSAKVYFSGVVTTTVANLILLMLLGASPSGAEEFHNGHMDFAEGCESGHKLSGALQADATAQVTDGVAVGSPKAGV